MPARGRGEDGTGDTGELDLDSTWIWIGPEFGLVLDLDYTWIWIGAGFGLDLDLDRDRDLDLELDLDWNIIWFRI